MFDDDEDVVIDDDVSKLSVKTQKVRPEARKFQRKTQCVLPLSQRTVQPTHRKATMKQVKPCRWIRTAFFPSKGMRLVKVEHFFPRPETVS